MPRRPAMVTQADIARAIRAVRDAGLPVVRVVVRPDGVAVETSGRMSQTAEALVDEDLAETREPVVL